MVPIPDPSAPSLMRRNRQRRGMKVAGVLLVGTLALGDRALAEDFLSASESGPSRNSQHRRTHRPAPASHGAQFVRPANWIFVPDLPGEGPVTDVTSGGDVNGDGLTDVVIGEAGHGRGRGRVLVFYGSTSGLRPEPDVIFEGAIDSYEFGRRVCLLGDVDGDGFDDLLVNRRITPSDGDTALTFRGGPDGLTESPGWTVPVGVVPIGDVNGDGCDDVAVAREDLVHETLVQVLYGSARGFGPRSDWTGYSEQRGSGFGNNIAGAGDVNGDGYADLLVGALRFSGRLRNSGKAYLYLGSAQGLSARPAWTAEYPFSTRKDIDEAYEQFFSWGLGSAGDVNHDGFDDVIVGACFADHGDLNEGLVFVYHGSVNGLSREPDWWAESNHAHSLLGTSVGSVGDVNGDSIDDVFVGLPEASDGQILEGASLVYHGSRSGLVSKPSWLMESDHSGEHFGKQMAGAGDLNGDGYADILVAGPDFAIHFNGSLTKCGRVLVSYGGPGGLGFSHGWSLEKPLLTALQQELNHYHRRLGSIVYWGPWLALLAGVSTGFLVVQSRLRRQLQAEIEKNRLLTIAQERLRLSRDLHDELGGHLARLSESGDLVGTALADAARGIATGIERTIWSLHPGHRSLTDLACGLTDLADNLLGDTPIRRRFDIPLDLPTTEMPAETLDAVYRATQEALNNVRKHSQASQVTVRLQYKADELQVDICDDGIGMTESATASKPGLGFASMASRLKELGGTWVARHIPPHGLMIRMVVPFFRPLGNDGSLAGRGQVGSPPMRAKVIQEALHSETEPAGP